MVRVHYRPKKKYGGDLVTKEYLKLFIKRKINWGLLTSLIVLQILELFEIYSQGSLIEFFITHRNLNIFALFLTPIFCFWNSSAYQVCSEIKCIVHMGSPFSYAKWYAKLSLLDSVLYVCFSNILLILGGIIVFKESETLGYIIILLFLQLVFYLNCAMLYFLVVTNLRDKFYLGFLIVVLYGLLDFIGQVLSLFIPWLNISTSYAVGTFEILNNPLLFVQNFSILLGTYFTLYVISAILIEKKDFMEWGKSHD